MILNSFMEKREELLHKVCYRKYICKDIVKIIIVNICNQTTAVLEDVSANFFECLASNTISEIKQFAKEKEISEEEIEEFIDDLIYEGIVGKTTTLESTNGNDKNINDNGLYRELKELYDCGYLVNTHIDILFDCNLRCIHCYHPFEDYKNKNTISLEEIKKYIDNVFELGVFFVTLSGGEIFLRNDLEEIIKYISSKGMVVNMLTNATLIDDNYISIIEKYNVQKIGISMYSIDEKIHDEITGVKGSCSKTKKAIEKLKETDVSVEINCVLMESNFEGYKEIWKYCKENNLSLNYDISMTPKLDGDTTPIEVRLNYEQMIKLMLDEESDYYIKNHKEIDWDNESCQAGKASLYCSPDGIIYPCVSFRLKLGEMENIKEIWKNSEELRMWREVKVKDFKGCGNLEYCKFCLEVCAGISLMETQDYLCGNTSNCMKAKARKEAYERLLL